MTRALLVIVSILAIGPATSSARNAPPSRAPASTSSSSEMEAKKLYDAGEFRKSSDLLWKEISKISDAGLILLIKAHQARSEWGDVIRACELLLGRKPKNEEALTYLGEAQFRLDGKTDAAKETLKKALEINPKFQPAYEVLTQIYEKNPYEQRLIYQDMVELFGPKPTFLTQLCSLNTNDGENEQGEKVCEQAAVAAPKIPENHVNLGLIAKQKGDDEVAKKRLRAAADRFLQSEFAQFEQASFLESQKNAIDANKYYEACVKADEKSSRCWVGLGTTASQINQFARSVEAFEKACRLSGRKTVPFVRKAASAISKTKKEGEWARKLSDLGDRCIRN